MRELVYLSEAKLSQFVSRPRRFLFWIKSVSTPIGGAEVERASEPGIAERLDDVEAQVAKKAHWYAEEGLRPGQWVHFEAPMNHRVLGGETYLLGPEAEMVVFLDAPSAPSADSVRLLLHGSAVHLTGSVRPAGQRMTSDLLGFLELANRMSRMEDEADEEKEAIVRADVASSGSFAFGTSRLIAKIDRPTGLETAIWMRGYARVSVVTEHGGVRCVVASPLYVEYTDPPEDAT